MEIVEIPHANVNPIRADRYAIGSESIALLNKITAASNGQNHVALSRSEIAGAVAASSMIEDDTGPFDSPQEFLAALTEPGEWMSQELRDRMASYEQQIAGYQWLLNEVSETLTSELLLEAHRRLFLESKPEIAGRFKQKEVAIHYVRSTSTNTIKTVPAAKTQEFINALCSRTEGLMTHSESAHKILAVGEFHCDLLAIHPFEDGNGRLSRMMVTWLLKRVSADLAGAYPLDKVILDSRPQYYHALFESQRNWHTEREDLTPWMEYYIRCLDEKQRLSKIPLN